jgi:3-isopropylmalate/(R)-2-methylmalate dehydratase small subunit
MTAVPEGDETMKGNAHVYKRAHINTDEIIPARYPVTDYEADLARHPMEDLDAAFVKNVKPGDIVVSGGDLGCGSSREHAVWALRGAGVACVVADSFARIYYRNSVNNGFPAVECKGASGKIDTGDDLDIDLAKGIVRNLTKGFELTFVPLPAFFSEIARAGGLLQSIRK